MNIKDKKKSIRFWDKNADSWQERAYGKAYFPISSERQNITVNMVLELAKNKRASIIDFGCADGELVRALVKKGFTNVIGIDNSKEMIRLAERKGKGKFFVADADNFNTEEKFDFVLAMGLIEYVLDIDKFFKSVKRILKPGGYAIIESRNKLFNLFSANKYTCQSDMGELVKELDSVKRFSPIINQKEIDRIIQRSFVPITLKGKRNKKKFGQYPFDLPQFTPQDIEIFSRRQGLKMKHVVYCHYHPFIPRYESQFPVIFNQIALSMRELGYTPLGATSCSSFIALIKK